MEYISGANINDEAQDNIVNNMIQDNMFHGNTIQINENVQFQEYNTIGPMNYTSVLPNMDNTTDNFYYLIENRVKNTKESNKAIVLKDRLLKELQELDENTIEELEKKENPLLNEFNVVLKKFKEGYQKLQDEFIEIDKTMQKEITKIKDNIKNLETMIKFINNLDETLKQDSICKEILNKIDELTGKIEKNSKFEEAKKSYSEKRLELNKYFDIIKSLNNLNVSNICPLCLTNKIELYIEPCGHCCCKTCKERLLQYEGSCRDANCFICRKRINNFNNIYLS